VVREMLAEILPSPIDVVGDMQIALEAAFGNGPGVAVNAGTGSFAYGRDRVGRTLRAGGWGFAIGDEGSAHWIGRTAVGALLRASDEDEQVADSSLAQNLFKTWKVNSLPDLARAANSIPPPDFASLLPAVVSCQDNIAREVLTAGGRELAKLSAIVVCRLFHRDDMGTVPVAVTGGVFRHSELVREIFYDELRRLDPRTQVNLHVVDPVEGALRMARGAATREHP
jgi:N-acetylglucosamine kinase-like BadF-type ATPase